MSKLLSKLREAKIKYDIGVDRGTIASLRYLLVDTKKQRGYPTLHRLIGTIDDGVRTLVAGIFAVHPMETDTGNIGTTCNMIERKRNENRKEGVTPTERRFSSLIAWDDWDDLSERVIRVVLMAKSHSVPINYEQLETDLIYRDRSRIEWATSFWGYVPKSKQKEGDVL